MVNHAAIKASRDHCRFVTLKQLEWAKDKILMGSERKSAVISESVKKLTAYHEGGHALVALYTSGAHPLHKVTIMPRGQALGITMQLPKDDQTSTTKKQLLARLDVSMGGRVAEELIFGDDNVTTGCSNDLSVATNLARQMIMNFGMGSEFGYQSIQMDAYDKLSSETRSIIEAETKKILSEAYTRAQLVLEKHKEELDRLAKALLDYETLSADEVKRAIKGLIFSSFFSF